MPSESVVIGRGVNFSVEQLYDLYKLTKEERQIIEASFGNEA